MKNFKVEIRKIMSHHNNIFDLSEDFWNCGMTTLVNPLLHKSNKRSVKLPFGGTPEINQKLIAISIVITQEKLNFSKNSRVIDV